MSIIYNNTTSKTKTHFLAAMQLIVDVKKKYNMPSERWAYPKMSFGDPLDVYYSVYFKINSMFLPLSENSNIAIGKVEK